MSKEIQKSPETFDTNKFFLIGNNLSLDFVNTLIAENGLRRDLLETPADLLAWATAAKLIDRLGAKKLAKSWATEKSAENFFALIKNFRAMLHEAVVDLARGESLKPATIKTINDILRENTGFVEITATEEGFEKIFRASYSEPRDLLAPVAESWTDLLCYGNLELLKKCEGAGCVLYFYDTTKNHRRRWCSMSGCGNRAKAAAFYQRQRQNPKN